MEVICVIAVGLENSVKFGDEPLTQSVKLCVSLRGSPLSFLNRWSEPPKVGQFHDARTLQ
jgi:hypothetical protein